jgi:HlyD family secretion protein
MKRRTKFTLGGAGIVVIAAAGFAVSSARGSSDDAGPATVVVERGDIVARALAVGTIEPEVQVSVKAKISGVASRAFAEAGDFVREGAPLLEIRPDPTPLELVEARRQLELRQIEHTNLARDIERQSALAERGLIARQELEVAQRRGDEAALQLRMAREKLQLLEEGRIRGGAGIESVVRAPISGFILERAVQTGDPVVPLTSYQEGTVLMTMADMGRLIFRGTVDEIDVGRLSEGMPVAIKIGALPDAAITGTVARISLKARKEESATTFPLEIVLDPVDGVTLRAGLSANADVIIQEARNVVVIPERTVTFADGGAWVNILRADGSTEKRAVRTGLSDAIMVEIVEGLEPGERVMEKPARTVG